MSKMLTFTVQVRTRSPQTTDNLVLGAILEGARRVHAGEHRKIPEVTDKILDEKNNTVGRWWLREGDA